jgi:NADH:ubiquinone oxidoreductase subunit H
MNKSDKERETDGGSALAALLFGGGWRSSVSWKAARSEWEGDGGDGGAIWEILKFWGWVF